MTSKGILFDLDGTLWDSTNQVTAAWNAVLARQPDAKRKSVTRAEIMGLMGKTMFEIYRTLMPEFDPERQSRIGTEACDVEQRLVAENGAKLFPGVPETLELLSRSYRLFIVSNCQVGYIESFLDYYGFSHFFSDTECFGRTRKCKGESIRILLDRSHLSKAVYVGDTQMDLDAADLAGIPFLHAAYGFGTVNRSVPAVKHFPDLPAAISKLL